MRGVLVAAAVVGALAVGGLPALALVTTSQDGAPAPAAAVRAERAGPPPWAKGPGRGQQGKDKVGHGTAMREWAHCVGDAARKLDPGEKLDPEAACGDKPTPPGHRR